MKCDRCGYDVPEGAVCPNCSENRGFKKDAGKPRPGLVSAEAMMGLSRVLAYGAKKYSDDNWRKGMPYRRVTDALMRHLFAFLGGEDRDPETGELHIDHIQCNAHFLSHYQHTNTGTDDRFKK